MSALQPRGITGGYTKAVDHSVSAKLSGASPLPYCRLPHNWLSPSGMIGYPHFSPRKKLPTGAFSVIFTSENAWLLCSIRGTFRHAIGYQSWIFKNETISLCLRKPTAAPDTFPLSSGSEEKTKSVSTLGFPGKAWGILWEFLLLLGYHHELPLDWLFSFGSWPAFLLSLLLLRAGPRAVRPPILPSLRASLLCHRGLLYAGCI